MNNIAWHLHALLSPESIQLLKDIGHTATERGESAYLVGGAVRDTILGKDTLDLDAAVEGKALSLAKQISRETGFPVKLHPRFGTATVFFDRFHIDLITARSETYQRPGALPAVQPGTIMDDLARRDFTINSLAAKLSPDCFGELIDPFRGQDDLKKGLIRVLHPKSFMDDPTRILRALRYQQRLDFEIEPQTLKLLRANLECLETVTGERLWHEMELILNELCPEKVFHQIEKLGLVKYLCDSMNGDDWLKERFARARQIDNGSMDLPKIYLGILMFRATDSEAEACIGRFKMPGWAARTVRETMDFKIGIQNLNNPDLRPSQVYQILKRYSPEVIRASALASDMPIVTRNVDLYFRELIGVNSELNGHDLQVMGVTSGRKIGQILRKLKDARMDKLVTSRQDEEEMVYRLLR